MRVNKYSIPIYNSSEIFELIYQDQSHNISKCYVDYDSDLSQLEKIANFNFNQESDLGDLENFDALYQDQWFMPKEYQNFDIEQYILALTTSNSESRVIEELTEYKSRDMISLLKWLKYFVDTCKKNNVVWGVGRGSSVASYVLYLLEVHRVDSIKYNLDWREFLR